MVAVSVLIPTYNRADLLMRRAIPTVLAQSFDDFEIIVAAHGCTDRTAECVAMDSRIRLIEVPRVETYPPTAENHWLVGPVAPLNAALEAATGEWIARIDDDDMWAPNHLLRLLNFAEANGYEFVSSAYERYRKGVREVIRHDEGNPPIGGVQTWLYRGYLKSMKYDPDCWKKEWNRVNDTDLAQRFREAGVRIGWLDAVTASVRPRPGESTVGLQVYLKDKAETEARFAF